MGLLLAGAGKGKTPASRSQTRHYAIKLVLCKCVDRDSDSMRARRNYCANNWKIFSVGLRKNRREDRYDKDREQRNNTESDISFQEITSQT